MLMFDLPNPGYHLIFMLLPAEMYFESNVHRLKSAKVWKCHILSVNIDHCGWFSRKDVFPVLLKWDEKIK